MTLTKHASFEEIDQATPEELRVFANKYYYAYLDYVEERAKRHPVIRQDVKEYKTPEGESIFVVENHRS